MVSDKFSESEEHLFEKFVYNVELTMHGWSAGLKIKVTNHHKFARILPIHLVQDVEAL